MTTKQKAPTNGKEIGIKSMGDTFFTKAKRDADVARVPGGYGAPKKKAAAPTMFSERGLKLPSDTIADNIMNGHYGKPKPQEKPHPIDAATKGVKSDAVADFLAGNAATHQGSMGKATIGKHGMKPRILEIAEVHGKANGPGTNGSGKVDVDFMLVKAGKHADIIADNAAAAAAYFTPKAEIAVQPDYPLRG